MPSAAVSAAPSWSTKFRHCLQLDAHFNARAVLASVRAVSGIRERIAGGYPPWHGGHPERQGGHVSHPAGRGFSEAAGSCLGSALHQGRHLLRDESRENRGQAQRPGECRTPDSVRRCWASLACYRSAKATISFRLPPNRPPRTPKAILTLTRPTSPAHCNPCLPAH